MIFSTSLHFIISSVEDTTYGIGSGNIGKNNDYGITSGNFGKSGDYEEDSESIGKSGGYGASSGSFGKNGGFGITSGNFGKTGGSGAGSGGFGKIGNSGVGSGSFGKSGGSGVGSGNFGKIGSSGTGSGSFGKTGGFGIGSGNVGKGGGLTYGDQEKSSRGEKGARGYITYQEFDKAAKGSKDNEQNKGFFKGSGGNSGGYYQVAGYFDSNKQGSKGGKGENFSGRKDNNKGSKTTGYHKVYLKDDYNKDHSFYDKADKNGYFRRYGDFQAHNDAKEGGFKKGGRQDNGFYGDVSGAKGYTDKGKVIDEAKGYKGAAGDQKYYQNNEEYSNKGGKVFGKEQGFTEGQKYTGR